MSGGALVAGRRLSGTHFDYRGYGRSQGQPSLAGAQQDIDAAWFFLQRADVEPNRL